MPLSNPRNDSILVVADHESDREPLVRMLRGRQYAVRGERDTSRAMGHIRDGIDLVVVDMRQQSMGEMELLENWKKRRPSTPFVLLAAVSDVEAAVRAMKLGANGFLVKPIEPSAFLKEVASLLDESHTKSARKTIRNPLAQTRGFEKIVGCSKPMHDACELVRRASLVDSTVLLTGESGTGKELFAEAIHRSSPRRDDPFITVNMAAVPESLVESELFGHVKGSFTGASGSRIGKFEAAHGGTLFIDEIGDFAGPSQAKLLRVLESHCITPVGGNEERAIDVRVVAATSRKLDEMVARGRFRADLYYRLNVIHIRIPPLRERRDGIPLLIDHFLNEIGRTIGRPVPDIEPDLLDKLINHEWPGNVRQLKNCLESMFVLSDRSNLRLEDLPESITKVKPASATDVINDMPLYDLERAAIHRALQNHDGNRTHAAKALRISVRTLQRKLKEFGEIGAK